MENSFDGDPVIPPVTKPPVPPVHEPTESAQPEVDPGEIEAVNEAKATNEQRPE